MRKPWFYIIDEPKPRKPWFQILDVCDARGGRSIADIAREVLAGSGVSLAEVRGPLMNAAFVQARQKIVHRVRRERPDLHSRHIAEFLNRDGSTIRHHWRQAAA